MQTLLEKSACYSVVDIAWLSIYKFCRLTMYGVSKPPHFLYSRFGTCIRMQPMNAQSNR